MSARRRWFVLAALIAPCALAANTTTLYDCPEPGGGRLLTNVPENPKACKAISVPTPPPAAPAPPAAHAAKPHAKAAPTVSPANFPKVDRETQQSRDNQRRRILEQELNSEQKLLDQAKKELAEQEAVRLGTERNYQKVLDRLEPYQKKVKQHEDNVASLRREIANLR